MEPGPASGSVASKNSERATHRDPGYRRALWIVVGLNVGYGILEMFGGIVSGSQALKADALDFLGDGAITLIGLLAIRWGDLWRARAALLQGLFLGALGIAVLANAAYRVLVTQQPNAEIMGALGVVALVINVASAVVLIPHRRGDVNVRAVWLFSRNDALGNAAVVLAAFMVFWSETPWPDLGAAAAIAGLFVHSAWRIVRDAGSDVRKLSVR